MILSTLMMLSKVGDLTDDSINASNLPLFRPRKTHEQVISEKQSKTWEYIEKYFKYVKKRNNDKANKIWFKIVENYNFIIQNNNRLPSEVFADVVVFKSFIEKGYFYNDILDKSLNKLVISKFIYRELIYGSEYGTSWINEEVDKLINLTPLQKQVLKLQRQAEYKIEVYKKYLPNHVDEVIKEIEEFEKEVIYNFEEQNPQLKTVIDNLNNINNNANQQVTNNVDVQQLMQQNQQLQQQMAQLQQQMSQLLQQNKDENNSDPGKVINNMLNREK